MNLKDTGQWDWTSISASRHHQRDAINLEELYQAFKERLLKEVKEEWASKQEPIDHKGGEG